MNPIGAKSKLKSDNLEKFIMLNRGTVAFNERAGKTRLPHRNEIG
jgi:hypothetical protein